MSRPSTPATSGEPAILPQEVRPNMTKSISSVHPIIIEDDDGQYYKKFKHKVHMYPSGPHIILPEVPVPPPRVHTAQPPRVDTEGTSSNLISTGKKNTIPHFTLTEEL